MTIEISVGDREFEDTPVAIHVPMPEDEGYLSISVSDEGVIIDAYDNTDECVGTVARTFDEWHEQLRSAGI